MNLSEELSKILLKKAATQVLMVLEMPLENGRVTLKQTNENFIEKIPTVIGPISVLAFLRTQRAIPLDQNMTEIVGALRTSRLIKKNESITEQHIYRKNSTDEKAEVFILSAGGQDD